MSPAIAIRTATTGEQQALEALQWRASLANDSDREALLKNPGAIILPLEQISAGQVFVSVRAGEIAGFAVLLPRDDGQVELDGLFVEPHIWKSGIGKALVNHCVSHARTSGARELHVIANPHALDFYKSCGFEITGTHETRFGPAVLMRLRITP